MINSLNQFPDLKKYDLSSLQQTAYGGSPMAPEPVLRTREVLPGVQGYGLTETGRSPIAGALWPITKFRAASSSRN